MWWGEIKHEHEHKYKHGTHMNNIGNISYYVYVLMYILYVNVYIYVNVCMYECMYVCICYPRRARTLCMSVTLKLTMTIAYRP